MSEPSKSNKQSWWHTLPGMLTATAAVITAITGLIVGLHQSGFFVKNQDVRQPAQMSSPATGEGPASIPEPKAGARSKASDAPLVDEKSSPQAQKGPQQKAPYKQAMGILKTSAGNLVFDHVTDMLMGQGKLTVLELGARLDIPLVKIKRITFQDKNVIRIDYWTGQSEETQFDCYWNLPVTFHAGDKEIYYGDCNDFRVVGEIEFYPIE